MISEEVKKAFDLWWNEEGKFITPSNSDWERTKEVIMLAWMNGAYVVELNNSKEI